VIIVSLVVIDEQSIFLWQWSAQRSSCAPGDHPAQPGIGGIVTSSRKVYKSNSWIPDRPDGFFGARRNDRR